MTDDLARVRGELREAVTQTHVSSPLTAFREYVIAILAALDAAEARLEASEAEQARLIADLDGAKDAATVAYKAEVARLTAERDALAAALKEAGEALEPIAEAAHAYDDTFDDDDGIDGCDVLIGSLRRARAALASIKAAIGET